MMSGVAAVAGFFLATAVVAACGDGVSQGEHDRVSSDLTAAQERLSGQEETIRSLAADLAMGLGRTEGLADFNDLLAEGPTVTDITPYSATVLATTDVDVVCGVSYGPTADYGWIATDMDMAGGGHVDHHPLLTGLEPDTEYHYSFGGIDVDGNVYRSGDFTFRTPPLDASEARRPAGDNLALSGNGARVAGASSVFGGGGNDGPWVTSIGFWTRTMGTSAEIFSFRVITDRGEVAGPFELGGAGAPHYFPTDLTAERLRFENVSTSGGNTGAVEIEVYGSPVG